MMDADKPANHEGEGPESASPPTSPAPSEVAPTSSEGAPPAAPAAAEHKPVPARKPIPEEMVARLRAGARKRKPWTATTWILALLMLALPVALAAWIFWPRPPPVPLVLTAFDQVGVPGQEVVCRARLEAQDPARTDVDLAGRELTFTEFRLTLAKGQAPPSKKVVTQAGGVAAVDWVVPEGAAQIQLTVRHVEADRSHETSDTARLFGWPRASRVLLVDAAALARGGDKLLQHKPIASVLLQPGAAAALRAARSAKFMLAYLATEPERGLRYRLIRDWIKHQAAGPEGIPDGPVLGRLSVAEAASAADFVRQVVEYLKRFDGPLVVVAGQEQTAEAFRAAGAHVLRVGQGALSWNKVAKELAK
jgi:hypothetical protein